MMGADSGRGLLMDFNTLSPYIRTALNSRVVATWELKERVIFDYEILYIKSGKILMTIDGEEYPGTRLAFRYTKEGAAGIDNSNRLRRAAAGGFTTAEVDTWAVWIITLTDVAFARGVDGGTDFNIIKWGSGDAATDGLDPVYIRSITVTPAAGGSSADKVALEEALALDEGKFTPESVGTAHYAAVKAAAVAVREWVTAPQQVVNFTVAALAAEQALLVAGDNADEVRDELEKLLKFAEDHERFMLRDFLDGDAYQDAKLKAVATLAADSSLSELEAALAALTAVLLDANGDILAGRFAALGDVSRTGEVDSTDARLVLQAEVNLINLDDGQQVLAKVSDDDVIDSTDARMILQHEVGLITLTSRHLALV